jgi:DNA/RNA endonuclease YhcR with UshA esterase domain
LDFANVSVQTPLIDRDDKPRRIDFTISEPGVKVAIEVDGFDKDGGGPMKPWTFDNWARREQDIVSNGWRLLRFTNRQARDRPASCVRSIELTLEIARRMAKRLADAEQGTARVEQDLRDAERRLAQAEDRLAAALATAHTASTDDRAAAEQVVHRRRRELTVERSAMTNVVESTAAEVLPAAATEFRGLELERFDGLDALDAEHEDLVRRAEHAEKENQNMKVLAGTFAVIAVAVAVTAVALSGGGKDASTQTSGQRDASCADALSWEDARTRIGETVTVLGPVVSATYRGRSTGKPTFLNVGKPFGDPERLVVVVWGRNRSKFPTPPERRYDDMTISVTGQVSEYQGVPQIEVTTPSEIETCAA